MQFTGTATFFLSLLSSVRFCRVYSREVEQSRLQCHLSSVIAHRKNLDRSLMLTPRSRMLAEELAGHRSEDERQTVGQGHGDGQLFDESAR